MKIPESIRIGGVEYSIEMVENLNNGSGLLYGQIDYPKSVIRINSTSWHQQQSISFLHECLHGIQNHIGVSLGDKEEEIIDMFARGIYQLLQDNGGRLFDLKEVSK